MRLRLFLVILPLFTTCCGHYSTKPLPKVYYPEPEHAQRQNLVIFLPGRWNGGASFVTEGFVDAALRAELNADIVEAEAVMGYYLEGCLPRRLHEDVIVPVKEKGYSRIWLVGISIGGLGALWYDHAYPGNVAGIVVFAPYLGEAGIVQEVRDAGGLTGWNPPVAQADGDAQRRIWRGLQDYVAISPLASRVFLAVGLQDPFSEAASLLAEAFPDDQVFWTEGGHDWPTWLRLWRSVLQKSLVPILRSEPVR